MLPYHCCQIIKFIKLSDCFLARCNLGLMKMKLLIALGIEFI